MNDKKKNQINYRKGISFIDESNSSKKYKKKVKSKKENNYISCKGTVVEAYSNARFLVEIDDIGSKINVVLAGKLRQNYIKILVGDRVELQLSIYDMTQGRISKRI